MSRENTETCATTVSIVLWKETLHKTGPRMWTLLSAKVKGQTDIVQECFEIFLFDGSERFLKKL